MPTRRHGALVTDVLDLKAFCLVADLRSLTAAAGVMGESKPTISRRIARLEAALDASLLVRSPRLVELTEEGVAYRARIVPILEMLDEANTAAAGVRAEPRGHLRVTAPPDIANALVAPIVARFAAKHPHVVVEMVVAAKVLDLDTERIDVALRVTRKLKSSRLVAHKLLDVELIAVASPEYLRIHPAPRTPAEIALHRVAFVGTARAPVVRLRRRNERGAAVVRLQPAVTSADLHFIKEVAIAGGALVFVPSAVVVNELRDGRLSRVLDDWCAERFGLYMLHHGGRLLSPKVRAFRDFVLANLRFKN